MNRILGLAVFGFCLMTSVPANGQILLDKIIASVGAEHILKSDVDAQLNYIKEQGQELPPDADCIVLDQMLANSLMVHQAKVDSVVVQDAEVNAQLDARIDRILQLMGGDMEQFLNQYGKTPSEIKDEQRDGLKDQLYAERMQGRIFEGASITPTEVIDFFNSVHPDSLPYFNSEVEIGEIVYKPVVNQEEKDRAYNKLLDIRNQIVNNGADFAELAKRHSEDYGSGQLGGDLGFAPRGTYVTEFEATAYNLDKMEVSDVIETQFGYHILQLLEKRGNTLNIRHILIRPQIQMIDFDNAKAHMDSIRNMIIQDTIPFSRAVKRFGYDKVQSFNNDGRLFNPKTGSSVFDVADISDPDVYLTIDALEVGEMSEPLRLTDDRGDQYYKIFKLISRTKPHRASLKTDYNKIRLAALEQKRSSYLTEWMESKIGNAFIFIDSTFDLCPNLDKWRKGQVARP